MTFTSKYVSKTPDSQGMIDYTPEENATWATLFARQIETVKNRACTEFLDGLKKLELPCDRIPQLPELNKALGRETGWGVHAVAALIPPRDFFNLLASRKFPVATFIRTPEELDYVEEPDIFHEAFGHCPMLTHPVLAEFVQKYGETVLSFPEAELPLLQRLFWFTVEFGLIQTREGLRAYGGGILSSHSETKYALESPIPERKPFDPLTVLRTPYRIDMQQMTYFILDTYESLYDVLNSDLAATLKTAHELGEFEPKFPVTDSPSVHIHQC